MSVDQREIEDLKLRLAEAERQLRRIRSGLKVGPVLLAVWVVLAVIPPLAPVAALALFGFVVLGALFAYMYGIAWAAERLTRAVGGEVPRTDQHE
jgi:hypothetical protein